MYLLLPQYLLPDTELSCGIPPSLELFNQHSEDVKSTEK